MSTEPLFLDQKLDFGLSKHAGIRTHLSDSADAWPQEILGEAFKRLPFLGNFEVHVVLDKIDDTRGYGFGSIEVRPHSDLPAAEKRVKLALVHIPILIKDQEMQPLDIFIHGKRYGHLTESRLRAALFRPDMFDSPQKAPPDPSFVTDLMPPSQGIFYGGGVKLGQSSSGTEGAASSANAGGFPASAPSEPPPTPPQQMAKSEPPPSPPTQTATTVPTTASMPTATKTAMIMPILPLLNGRVLERHIDRVKTAMADPSLMAAYANANEGVRAALLSAMGLTPISLEKSAAVLQANLRPDAVQISKLDNGNFLVKWAAANAYAPQQEEVPPEAAQDLTGQGPAADQLQQTGEMTAGTGDVNKAMGDEEVQVASQFGLWKVQDVNGNQLIGFVFPSICSLDGSQTGTALFTNGSQYALQDAIAGKILGKATDLPKTPPAGHGCFYTTNDGSAKAYEPMTIVSTFQGPDGQVHYTGQTDGGESVTFTLSEIIKNPTRVSESEFLVPSSFRWLPLKAETELVQDPTMFTKVATSKWTGTADLVSDGSVYSYRGPAVEKIAGRATFINRSEAEFLGVLMGLTPVFSKTAAARAASGACVSLRGLRPITPISEKLAHSRSVVKTELENLNPPIRNYFLLKEASLLDDALTADKILGLGFINAENVATFVEMLPQLEETSAKLAELLFFVRLGRPEIPEVAIERMLAALDDVINGLRSLKQKEVHFGE